VIQQTYRYYLILPYLTLPESYRDPTNLQVLPYLTLPYLACGVDACG